MSHDRRSAEAISGSRTIVSSFEVDSAIPLLPELQSLTALLTNSTRTEAGRGG
jgi:hypothetical protein